MEEIDPMLQLHPGHTVVCQEHQVENYSLRGFALRAIVCGDYPTTLFEEEEANGYPTRTVKKTGVLREPRFVMHQTADETMARLTAELESYREDSAEHWEEREKSRKETAALNARVEELKAECERLKEARNREQARVEEMRTVKLRLEVDLEKLRTALGDLKFKEILG